MRHARSKSWRHTLAAKWDAQLARHRERMKERRRLAPYLTRVHGLIVLSDAGRKLLSEGGQQ